jgi:hypothetical protein
METPTGSLRPNLSSPAWIASVEAPGRFVEFFIVPKRVAHFGYESQAPIWRSDRNAPIKFQAETELRIGPKLAPLPQLYISYKI